MGAQLPLRADPRWQRSGAGVVPPAPRPWSEGPADAAAVTAAVASLGALGHTAASGSASSAIAGADSYEFGCTGVGQQDMRGIAAALWATVEGRRRSSEEFERGVSTAETGKVKESRRPTLSA
jgi:hypothetical protein